MWSDRTKVALREKNISKEKNRRHVFVFVFVVYMLN